jgi:hypothetical protein
MLELGRRAAAVGLDHHTYAQSLLDRVVNP